MYRDELLKFKQQFWRGELSRQGSVALTAKANGVSRTWLHGEVKRLGIYEPHRCRWDDPLPSTFVSKRGAYSPFSAQRERDRLIKAG